MVIRVLFIAAVSVAEEIVQAKLVEKAL